MVKNLSIAVPSEQHLESSLSKAYEDLDLGGEIHLRNAALEDYHLKLLLAGFVDIVSDGKCGGVRAKKPSYERGTAVALSERTTLLKEKDREWRKALENADDGELMEEDELEKLDGVDSQVCPPSLVGKRMPCANCTCGLKEEMESDVKGARTVKIGEKITAEEMQKASACGNCGLGDAFRCAGCPYLGMEPFKEGEKVVISDALMAGDL